MSNSSLPEDLIFDILLRLPVKSLLRFKSVCKSWRSMITGRRFVSEHLKRSSMNGSSAGAHHLAVVEHRTATALLSSTLEVQGELETPPIISSCKFAIAGSCNGIVCLTSPNGTSALLWNPAIRQSRTLPNSVVGKAYNGFGYSSKIDDYKLIRISKPGDHLWAKVYTLREGSWREVQPPDYYPDYHNIGGTFVNGTVNWIACGVRDESRAILSFDLEKDEFKSISLPPGFEDDDSIKKVAALESSLLFIACDWREGVRCIDLWMTNPQATQPVWTRLTTVYPLVPYPWPLGMGRRGEIYIANCFGEYQLYAYEPSTGKWNCLHSTARIPSHSDLHPYVESLVPLLGE